MHTHAKDQQRKPKRNRKARNVLALSPDDPNYDTLKFSIEKRERARAKRRQDSQAKAASS